MFPMVGLNGASYNVSQITPNPSDLNTVYMNGGCEVYCVP
jgi:hypothetical protein